MCAARGGAYHVGQALRWPASLHEIAGVVPPCGGAGCPVRRWARQAVVPAGRVPFGGVDMRRLGYPDGAGDGGGLLERAEQLALLNQAVTAVADGRCGRTVLVMGEAGIGKTAL